MSKPTRTRYEVLPTGIRARKEDPTLRAWSITRNGQRLSTEDTQALAIQTAATIARCAWKTQGSRSELRIKGGDGKIRDARTYGADPISSKG